jgi:Holliday junction DNA helicase RuvA
MIARIRGRVIEKSFDSAIIDVGGVGYEIFLAPRDASDLQLGDEVSLTIYEHIREDQHALYGFREPGAKQFFAKLLTISGVGPKVAMAVLATATLERLQQAVASGDPDLLRGVSGVGAKTAQRIIIELKGKINESPGMVADETYQALVSLGYSNNQAAEAVAALPADVKDPAERVKVALKGLAK